MTSRRFSSDNILNIELCQLILKQIVKVIWKVINDLLIINITKILPNYNIKIFINLSNFI